MHYVLVLYLDIMYLYMCIRPEALLFLIYFFNKLWAVLLFVLLENSDFFKIYLFQSMNYSVRTKPKISLFKMSNLLKSLAE